MNGMEAKARALFQDYSRRSNEALHDPERADIDALADAFAGHFVGANPAGVMGGAKDGSFPAIMRKGFETYRATGGTRFEIVNLEVEELDGFNAMVRACAPARRCEGDHRLPQHLSRQLRGRPAGDLRVDNPGRGAGDEGSRAGLTTEARRGPLLTPSCGS